MANISEVIFYDSIGEKYSYLTFYFILCIYCLLSNGILGSTIVKYPKFHTPHFLVIAVYMVVDVISTLSQSTNRIMLLLLKHDYPIALCRFAGFLFSSALTSSIHLLALISIERWFFFCKPYNYLRVMSMKNVAWMSAGIGFVSILIVTIFEFFQPRENIRASTLSCVSSAYSIWYNVLFFGIYLLPSGISTLFSIVKIYKLAKRSSSIFPVLYNNYFVNRSQRNVKDNDTMAGRVLARRNSGMTTHGVTTNTRACNIDEIFTVQGTTENVKRDISVQTSKEEAKSVDGTEKQFDLSDSNDEIEHLTDKQKPSLHVPELEDTNKHPGPIQLPGPVQEPVQIQGPVQHPEPVQHPGSVEIQGPIQHPEPVQHPGSVQIQGPVQNPGPVQHHEPIQHPGPIQPAGPSQHPVPSQPPEPPVITKSQAKSMVMPYRRVLRMILVVSGIFWLTLIPGFAMSTAITMTGVTWDLLDRRDCSDGIFFLHQITLFIFYDLAKILNPIFLYYTHPQLRSGVKRFLGFKINLVDSA